MSIETLDQREREQTEEQAESNLDRLVKRGEWQQLKDNKEYQSMSLEGRISCAQDTINVRIHQMEKIFVQVVRRNPEKAGIILEKAITPMRFLNEALAVRFLGELEDRNMGAAVNNVLRIENRIPQQQVFSRKKAA